MFLVVGSTLLPVVCAAKCITSRLPRLASIVCFSICLSANYLNSRPLVSPLYCHDIALPSLLIQSITSYYISYISMSITPELVTLKIPVSPKTLLALFSPRKISIVYHLSSSTVLLLPLTFSSHFIYKVSCISSISPFCRLPLLYSSRLVLLFFKSPGICLLIMIDVETCPVQAHQIEALNHGSFRSAFSERVISDCLTAISKP